MRDTIAPDERDRSPSTTRVSRRRLLAAGGAMAASAVSVATAGCLGNGDENGSEDSAVPEFERIVVAGQAMPGTVSTDRSTISIEVGVVNGGDAPGAFDVGVTGALESAATSTATLESGEVEVVTFDGIAVPEAEITETIHLFTVRVSNGENEQDYHGRLTVRGLDMEPTILGVEAGGTPLEEPYETRRILAGTELPLDVQLTNDGSEASAFDVTVTTEEVETVVTSDVIEGSATETVSFTGLTPDLSPGTHTLSVETATDEYPIELVVAAEPTLYVTAYTQSVAEENLATGGTLTVTDEGGEIVAERDLSESASHTVSEGIDDGETYTLTVEEPNDGTFPPASKPVTVDGVADVAVVAGYEFRGAESYDFTTYIWWATEGEEHGFRGTHAGTDNHYTQSVESNTDAPTFAREDRLFSRDIGTREFQQLLQGDNPLTEIVVDRQGYTRVESSESDGSWTEMPSEEVRQKPSDTLPHSTALTPLERTTENEAASLSFVAEDELGNVPVDVYELTFSRTISGFEEATIYVDPATGYILRWESGFQPNPSPSPNSYYVVEFTNHDERETFDFDAIGFDRDDPDISTE